VILFHSLLERNIPTGQHLFLRLSLSHLSNNSNKAIGYKKKCIDQQQVLNSKQTVEQIQLKPLALLYVLERTLGRNGTCFISQYQETRGLTVRKMSRWFIGKRTLYTSLFAVDQLLPTMSPV
jgi:hypothetical protein